MESLSKTEPKVETLDLDFAKTIEESKEIVQAEKQKEVKRGRGRPRKSTDSAGEKTASAASATTSAPPAEPVDLSPYLAVPLRLVSQGPARTHRIPELALTEAEALECAKAINDCFNAFVPNLSQMSPKSAAILGAAMIIGSIGFTKYQIYAEVSAKRELEAAPRPGNDKAEASLAELKIEPGQVPADNYFRR